MKVYEAPQSINDWSKFTVFLGGGITGCPDWQAEMIELLDEKLSGPLNDKVALFNPRRANFNVNNPAESEIQIKWEFNQLHAADVILFWFPCETLCPITLLELGKHMMVPVPLCVGCHPDYKRKFDVKYQLGLECAGVNVVDSLDALADEVVIQLLNLNLDRGNQ